MIKLVQSYINGFKDGLNIIIILLMIGIIILQFALLYNFPSIIIIITIMILSLFILFTLHFFRKPIRHASYNNKAIYAPADGKITSINIVKENTYHHAKTYRIKIFMNIFNVHRNLIPLAGTAENITYKKGRFKNAFLEVEDSNEQCIISLKTKMGKILIKQIAGLIARRIVCIIRKKDQVQTGQEFGLIKFGSAVILYVPSGLKLLIKPGDKVKAGLTMIAQAKK